MSKYDSLLQHKKSARFVLAAYLTLLAFELATL